MKAIVWMTRETWRILSQQRVDCPTFPVNRRYFHLVVILARLLSRSDKPPDIWNAQGLSGNVFANPRASSSSPYPGGFNHWISNGTEDTSPHVTSERQIPDTALNPRFQSGLWAGNSFDTKEGIFSKELWGRPTKTADLGTSLCQIP